MKYEPQNVLLESWLTWNLESIGLVGGKEDQKDSAMYLWWSRDGEMINWSLRKLRVIQAQSSTNVGASITNPRNSILIMENSYSGVCEALETPNIYFFPSILSLVTILIWSCFIL